MTLNSVHYQAKEKKKKEKMETHVMAMAIKHLQQLNSLTTAFICFYLSVKSKSNTSLTLPKPIIKLIGYFVIEPLFEHHSGICLTFHTMQEDLSLLKCVLKRNSQRRRRERRVGRERTKRLKKLRKRKHIKNVF